MIRAGRPTAALGLTLAITAASLPLNALAETSAPTAPTEASQQLQWGPCPADDGIDDPDYQCAPVRVPLDYNSPDGPSEEILVAKMSASRSNPKGTLVVNYGFPGTGAHRDVLDQNYYRLPSALTDVFDTIAIDHRGVTHNAEQRCLETSRDQDNIVEPIDEFPSDTGERLNYLSAAKDFAAECKKNLPAHLVAANTALHAKDLNEVRKALGLETLNILGFEGQGQLAQHYADAFPDTVRAVAIGNYHDAKAVQGTAATSRQSRAERTGTIAAHEKTLNAILAVCQKAGKSQCALAQEDGKGLTPRATVDRVMAHLKDTDLTLVEIYRIIDEDGKVIDEWTSKETYGWWQAYELLQRALETPRVESPLVATIFEHLNRAIDGDNERIIEYSGGESIAEIKKRASLLHGVRAQHGGIDEYYQKYTDFRLLTVCNDSAFQPGTFSARKRAARAHRLSKIFAEPLVWSSLYCHAWNNPMAAPQASFNAKTEHPIFFVAQKYSATHDYDAAKRAADRFPNSFLLTNEGWDGYIYPDNTCVADAVNNYILTLQTPESDVCQAEYPLFDESTDDILADTKKLTTQREERQSAKNLAKLPH